MAQPAGGEPADQVRQLLEDCLERLEVEGPGVFEEACARHPELAAALRKRVAVLRKAGLLDQPSDPVEVRPKVPERLGEFRVLSRIGGGGMGVVYLAEQETLKRRVAIKLVRPETLYFDGAKDRFLREAEAVARLQHSGIVPIYTVGEQDGLPYFAMEYVEGCSLADVLERLRGRRPEHLTGGDLGAAVVASLPESERAGAVLPSFGHSWVEACFRVAAEVARALSHAHTRGVLHRDIKPSNVMIARDGRVLLVDFGLAAVQGSERLTRSGTHMGSLLYMPPEQLRGRGPAAHDERGDVYSLGVTLFELLTLQAPFRADNNEALMLAILGGDPPRARRLNPALPWDAEAVVHKAIDLDPHLRYASAEAFAADLRNVLELRPVSASRPSFTARVRRFTHRRPAAALALLFLAVVIIGAPGLYGLIERRARQRLDAAYREVDAARAGLATALAQAEDERRRAESYLERTFDAVDRSLVRMGADVLADTPRATGVRLALLQDALDIFQGFRTEQGDHPRLRRELAHCERRVAYILILLERPADAIKAAESAVRRFESLIDADPEDPELRDGIAYALAWKARGHRTLGQTEEAEATLRASLATMTWLLEHAPDRERALVGHVERTAFLALLLSEHARHAEARTELEHALELLDPAALQTRDSAALQRTRALVLNTLAGSLYPLGDPQGAIARLREAVEAGRAAVAGNATDTLALRTLAGALSNLAAHLDDSGAGKAAIDLHAEAVRYWRQLFELLPDQPEVIDQLARALVLAGQGAVQREDPAAAEPYLVEALALRRELARRFPQLLQYRIGPATALGNLGDLYAQTGRSREARQAFAEANGVLRAAQAEIPDPVFLNRNLGLNERALAEVALHEQDPATAGQHSAQAVALLRENTRLRPDDVGERGNLVSALQLDGEIRILRGDHAGAAECARELARLDPESAEGCAGAAVLWMRAVECARTAGADAALLLEYTTQAVARLREAVERGFTEPAELLGESCDPIRDDPGFQELLREVES